MDNNKISFQQFNDPAFRRAEQMTVKSEAVWVAFSELDGLLNFSKLAKQYFNRSQSWFAQKLTGLTVQGKVRAFSAQEYSRISQAFRDIARRLIEYADAIDNAKL